MPPIPSPSPAPSISIAPPAAPAPAPVSPTVASSNLNIVLVIAATVAASMLAMLGMLAVLGAVVYFGGLWPHPAPATTDFVKLGAEYGKQLGPSYAPAWKAYAADLRAGKSLGDAVKNTNGVWKDNREAIYQKFIAPELSKIVPDGTPDEQVTPAQRAAMAAAADGLAKGLGEPP